MDIKDIDFNKIEETVIQNTEIKFNNNSGFEYDFIKTMQKISAKTVTAYFEELKKLEK